MENDGPSFVIHRRPIGWPTLLLPLLLIACSSPEAAPTAPTAATAAPAPAGAPVGARSYPESATFGELVSALRADPSEKPGRSCLLSATGPLTFEAPVAAGRPEIPDPPADLDALLAGPPSGSLRLWASWGESDGGDLLDLVALTPVSRVIRSTITPVFVLTNKGTYFLALGMAGQAKLITPEDLPKLKTGVVPRASAWVLTAEAGVPLGRFREPLTWIAESKGSVVLATASPELLGPSRRISRYESKVGPADPNACDLNAMQKPGNPMGSFGSRQMTALSDSFQSVSGQCGAALQAGDGGGIHMMTRISASGNVEAACVETDDTNNAALRQCTVDAVRKLKVEPPATPGTVNFGTTILYPGPRIAGLCP